MPRWCSSAATARSESPRARSWRATTPDVSRGDRCGSSSRRDVSTCNETGLSPPASGRARVAVRWDAMEPLRWLVIAERVSAPAAVATGERRLTLFARGAGGDLVVLERDPGDWTAPRSLCIQLSRTQGPGSPPIPVEWPIAACATGPVAIQLVARGAEGELVHGTFRAGEWDG